MTDYLKMIEDLSSRARREEPPTVDVSQRVVLGLHREAPSPAWPMVLMASSAAAAAAVVLIVNVPVIEMLTDPLSAFFMIASNALP